jgi:hypothetical protein
MSNAKDAGQEDDSAKMSTEKLEDALMQMELALRSQDEERRIKSPDDNVVLKLMENASCGVAGASLTQPSITAASRRALLPAADFRKIAAMPLPHTKGRAAAAASAANSRVSGSSKQALSGQSLHTTTKSSRATKKVAECSAMPVSLPVGSVVFSVRQLLEKNTLVKNGKVPLTKSRSQQHRSAFAQVSDLFSCSPSRSSSSAMALREAEAARQCALNGIQSRHSDASAPAASYDGWHGLEDDGDESQLPIGVLEALMVRPTGAVEEDKRLLKVALDSENK